MLTQASILELTRAFSDRATSKFGASHDASHIERVVNMAGYLARSEGADPYLVELIATLHDSFDRKLGRSYETSCDIKEELVLAGIPSELAGSLAETILEISYGGSVRLDRPLELEGRCVRDADRLDAMGSIGVVRAIMYGTESGQPFWDPEIRPRVFKSSLEYRSATTTTVNHFFEKILCLQSGLETTTARMIGRSRHAATVAFLTELLNELDAPGEWTEMLSSVSVESSN